MVDFYLQRDDGSGKPRYGMNASFSICLPINTKNLLRHITDSIIEVIELDGVSRRAGEEPDASLPQLICDEVYSCLSKKHGEL